MRFLQDRVVERVGGREGIAVDVRVVCATNKRHFGGGRKAGRFRSDLFHRLAQVKLEIPPLRERPGDAIVIAQTVMERRAREHSRSLRGFTPDALKAIQGYPWPGNIRELENRVTSAVIMSEGKHIGVDELGLVDVANAGVDWLNLRLPGTVPNQTLSARHWPFAQSVTPPNYSASRGRRCTTCSKNFHQRDRTGHGKGERRARMTGKQHKDGRASVPRLAAAR